ncbi:MAG: cytochrome c [Thiobacillus sp.]|nr:cytochrome c [Thiobacillus sp.]
MKMNFRQRAPAFLQTGLFLASCFLVAGHAAAEEPNTKRAVRNYDTYCVQCHGINRNGRGINSRDMSVQPRDHGDAKGMGGIPDEEIFRVIKEGGLAVNKSVLMPAWGNVMNDEEIKELVAYLRFVCNCGLGK